MIIILDMRWRHKATLKPPPATINSDAAPLKSYSEVIFICCQGRAFLGGRGQWTVIPYLRLGRVAASTSSGEGAAADLRLPFSLSPPLVHPAIVILILGNGGVVRRMLSSFQP